MNSFDSNSIPTDSLNYSDSHKWAESGTKFNFNDDSVVFDRKSIDIDTSFDFHL